MTRTSEKTIFAYERYPTSVYTNDTARLSISVNNRTGEKKDCESIVFIVPESLTSDPGTITVSSSAPEKWDIQRDEGATGQFNATPIPPVTGLDKDEGVLFTLDKVRVNDTTGPTTIGIEEMTDEFREGGVDFIKIRPDVTIKYFKSDPSSIAPGGATSLSWTTEGAASCTLSWADKTKGVPVNGSEPVSPLDTTTYTLTAYGRGTYTPSSQATVNVIRVKILDYTAPLDPIPMGSEAELRWRTDLATRCEVRENGKPIERQAPLDAYSTPFKVKPTASPTAYKLVAYYSDSIYKDEVKEVFLQPVPKLSLSKKWKPAEEFLKVATPPAPHEDQRLFLTTRTAIQVFDRSKLSEIRSLPISMAAMSAFSPDGKKMLEYDWGRNTLMVIDSSPGSSYNVLAQIPFKTQERPQRPDHLLFNPAGTRFYVPASEPYFCYVFETASAAQVDKFQIPASSGRGDISPDGSRLCVISGTQTISIIDLSTKKAETITLGAPNLPERAVWSRDGSKIYVSEILYGQGRLGSHIWIVDPTGKQQHKKLDMKPDWLVTDLILAPPTLDALLATDRLYAICLIPNTSDLLSSNKSVVAISTTKDTIVEDLLLNEGIKSLSSLILHGAISADGRNIYVPSDDTVCIVDTTTAPPRPGVPSLEQPINSDDLAAYLSGKVRDF